MGSPFNPEHQQYGAQPPGAYVQTFQQPHLAPNGAYYSPGAQQGGQQPIFVQPGAVPAWQDQNLLGPLMGADKILVKQKKEMIEILTSWETNNRYEVLDGMGRLIYYAFEDTSMLSICCFGENRPFCIRVVDLQGRQVMVLNSSIDCCTREVTVEVPAGNFMANIFQEFAFFAPSFYIRDAAGNLIFKIKSPLTAAIGSLGNVNFNVLSSDQSTVVGQISKQWGGLLREWLTDADVFGVSFPSDMDPSWKAVLLAATFVVDFEFYEKSSR